MTIKEMFNKAITDAFKSAYLITEEDKKAVALAQIAAALAQTGAIASSDIEDNSEKSEEKEETKAKNEKKSYKPKKKQGEKLQKQPYDLSDEVPDKVSKEISEEAPNEVSEDSEEVEMAEEWTDETMEKYNSELTYIEDFNERNDPDGSTKLLDSCVEEYSSGVLHSFEDIKPRNVVSFVSWLKDVESAGAEENDG